MNQRFFAPAKINLSLRVYTPDATGYHPIDTLLCALELADEITCDFTAEGIQLDVSGAALGPPSTNLAYRAADEFFRTTGLPPRVGMLLHKRIPAGGGLGGGSSDAAAVLRALNRQYENVLDESDVLSIAGRLGSDVAFFVCGSTLAHATGYGETLRMLPPLPAAPVIVVVPAFGIATANAYGWIDQARAYSAPAPAAAAPSDWSAVQRLAHNAFEAVVFPRFPLLGELKATLARCGARIALLSGSGSSVFGMFETVAERDAAAEQLRDAFPDVAVVMTTTCG